ncbi:ABC transporter substrate-binding protein [Antarcticirhabdus aurantiaca]|uniref:ABC transporter substrate-binding protein n=1 Tax=Antarcticirhabdus aurantiaca TaxID=2606717 RepID=A0ACD4NNH5_9HYPH|nr:ABC transporter substrate-binding protein [Antarcticirhabdus aurantiaca]WAJ28216.1 ABC transporter substrate-binding protein [Jeongeuplla avenae]
MTIDRRRFNQFLLLGGIGLGAGFSLPAFAEVAAPAAQPVPGGTLNIVYHPEPNGLVSINTSAGGPQFVGSKLFDGLLDYDYDLNPRPQIAESWAVSEDGLDYVFNIRRGITFHDGTPLTSADVAFSILRLKEAHPRGRAIFAQVESIDTTDPHVARLKLAKPSPALITALAASESPIVPKHIYETLKPEENPTVAQIVGSGPFKLNEWVPGSHVILDKNPDYWDGPRPYLDRVVVRLINDPGARAAALEAGEVDIGPNPVPLSDIERFRAIPNLVVDDRVYAYAGNFNQLTLNLENEYLKNLKVRRAIAHSLDLQALLDIVLYGYGVISPTPIGPGLARFQNTDIQPAAFDPERAKALLDEAGYPIGADGRRFSLRLTNNPFNPPAYADFIKQALAGVGIDAQIERFDFATFVKKVYTDRAWDLSVDAMSNTFDPTAGVQRVYWSRNFKIGLPFSNASRYENPEVDRLLEAAAVEPDEAKRIALFKEFQVIVNQDLPVINLIQPIQPIVANRKVRDYAVGATGLISGLQHTWIDPTAA